MTSCHVSVVEFEELTKLDGDWNATDFTALLVKLDMDGGATLDSDEGKEMCLMALSDLEPEAAASVLLTYKLEGELTEGQIRNYSNECQFEKLWEQSAEMQLHRRIFSVASLLAEINEQVFPTPDAIKVRFQIDCPAGQATEFDPPIESADVLRMVALGMEDGAILKRLFHDQLEGGPFPEADSIAWEAHSVRNEKGIELTVVSSGYWLDGLSETEGFQWESQAADE